MSADKANPVPRRLENRVAILAQHHRKAIASLEDSKPRSRANSFTVSSGRSSVPARSSSLQRPKVSSLRAEPEEPEEEPEELGPGRSLLLGRAEAPFF